MKSRRRIALAPLLLAALATFLVDRQAVSEPSGKLLAVLEFKGANLKADILDTMSDAVRGGASDALSTTGINVMTRESMLVLLKEMGIKECSEGDCEVESARNIGADYVISGRIVQMEGTYVATLKLHETKRGTLLGTRDAEAKKQKDLWHALKEQGRKLVADKLARPGPISIASPDRPSRPAPPSPAAAPPASSSPAIAPASSGQPGRPVLGCASNQVGVPGGTFWMGSEDGLADERLVHKVTLSPYCIDRTEVTVAAYGACVQTGKCRSPGTAGVCNWGRDGVDQHPINCVDWHQAKTFCEWAGGRLPTEAEWEFAARGSDGRKYPWGNEAPALQLCWNGRGNDVDRWKRQGTCPVGRYPSGASPFGVLDMAGNVFEWTTDAYRPYSADAQQDPQGDRPNAELRVRRGGGWDTVASFMVRAAGRYRDGPHARDYNLGFRCARDATQSPLRPQD